MLPETSWKRLGLSGSMLVLNRTVPSTSDFFWTGRVCFKNDADVHCFDLNRICCHL